MDNGKIHVFLGYSGCGKSTVSKRLEREEGFARIATADIVKQLGGKDNKEIKDGGLFKGEDKLRELLTGKLNHHLKAGKQILLDGFPRTMDQFDWLLQHFGDKLGRIVYLDLDIGPCKAHLLKRGRTDIPGYDEEDIIDKRLAREAEEYPMLWKYIKKRRGYYNVDDYRPMDEVYDDILIILKNRELELI